MRTNLTTLLIAIFIGYTILSFLFAFSGYPGLMQDSICFLPTSYFINHYHQLINPIYDAGIDPVHHKFLFYPPLFPYVIAYITKLMPNSDNAIYIALTIIDTLTIGVLFFSIYLYYKRNRIKFNISLCIYTIIWVLSLFSFFGVVEGRPEVLSKFFITCFLFNNIYKSERFYNLNDGLIIGLNLITSPISTFYLIVIKIGLIIYESNLKVKPILETLTGFAIILISFGFLYPYSISELINGLHQHSQNAIFNRVDHDAVRKFISVNILNPYYPISVIVFLIAISYAFYKVVYRKIILSIIALIFLTAMICYFSFKDMFMNYNMIVLAPLCFFLLFILFNQLNEKTPTYFNKILSLALVLTLLINSVGFIRKAMLFYSTENNKVTYKDFRKEFIKVYNGTKKNEKIAISFSLWPYCIDKFKNITVSTTDTTVRYIILQQLYSGFSEPSSQPGFHIVKNGFINKHPMFGKFKLGNTFPWFQTAIYKRD